ncbi:MAG: SPOR domain-containing protein [Deferrisomatales bacterium]
MRAYRKVEDHYELRIEGGRVVLLGVGAGFVLLLVFLLGLLVGKSLGPAQPPAAAVAEAPREAEAPVAVAQPQAAPEPAQVALTPEPPKPELTFYKELKEPDVAPRLPEPAAEVRPAVAPPPVANPAPEPASAPGAEPKPALPAPVFTVQVGSFQDRAAAEDLVKRVGGQGVAAQVVAAPVSGRTWYRVQVGRFETRAEAEANYRDRLRAKGVQGFVTTR